MGWTNAKGSTRGPGMVRKMPVTSPQGVRGQQRAGEGQGQDWWALLQEAETEFGTLTSFWWGSLSDLCSHLQPRLLGEESVQMVSLPLSSKSHQLKARPEDLPPNSNGDCPLVTFK